MVIAFWAAMGYFVFWAVPWFPGGLDEKDYTERVAFTFVLGGLCGVLGIGTLVVREYLRRTRESLLAWTAVYDDTTGLYNRQYFYDRLSLECERARRQGTTFSSSSCALNMEPDTGVALAPMLCGGCRRRWAGWRAPTTQSRRWEAASWR
jgi:hypothetical protein